MCKQISEMESLSNSENHTLNVTWEDALKQFDNLIKFAASKQISTSYNDSMYTVEDLYQEGLIKLYDCWHKWCFNPENNKDMEEFGAIFKVSLFRAVKKGSNRKKDGGGNFVEIVDLEDSAMENMVGDEGNIDIVEKMYREYGINEICKLLSPTALELLNEMLNPSAFTLYEVWANSKRKEMLREQGVKVAVPKTNTIKMKHIVKSLGLTTKQYDVAMSEIKEKAKLIML